MAGLYFIRRVAQNPSDTFMLWSIDVWDPAASTREGIRMGARLPNVLRTYGDTGDNFHMGQSGPATNCLDITIRGDRSGTQTSYERPTLSLTYFDRGVKFDLDWAGTPGAFLVRSMTVTSPAECRPLWKETR